MGVREKGESKVTGVFLYRARVAPPLPVDEFRPNRDKNLKLLVAKTGYDSGRAWKLNPFLPKSRTQAL